MANAKIFLTVGYGLEVLSTKGFGSNSELKAYIKEYIAKNHKRVLKSGNKCYIEKVVYTFTSGKQFTEVVA